MGWGVLGSVVGGLLGRKSDKKNSKRAYKDSVKLANLQHDHNMQALRESLMASRVNESNPFGELQWQQGQDGRWSKTTTLNPEDQQTLDFRRGVSNSLLGSLFNPREAAAPEGGAERPITTKPVGPAVPFNPAVGEAGNVPQNINIPSIPGLGGGMGINLPNLQRILSNLPQNQTPETPETPAVREQAPLSPADGGLLARVITQSQTPLSFDGLQKVGLSETRGSDNKLPQFSKLSEALAAGRGPRKERFAPDKGFSGMRSI